MQRAVFVCSVEACCRVSAVPAVFASCDVIGSVAIGPKLRDALRRVSPKLSILDSVYISPHPHTTKALVKDEAMADTQEDVQMDTQEIELETPPSDVFMAPSIDKPTILAGNSYSHFSPIPQQIAEDMSKEVVLGVDEAGRGPVLGE
jgi:hypothetical protein